MICVVIRTDRNGLLRSVYVTGHARHAKRGRDIVCAAVSAISRSAARILELDGRIEVVGDAQEPGRLSFEVPTYESGAEEYIRGVTDFLVLGLADISREYPQRCCVEVKEEQTNGT